MMHKVGVSFKFLKSLDGIKTNQNGKFLYFGENIAFEDQIVFEKESSTM